MIDPKAAQMLRTLFTSKAGSAQYLLPEASIRLENAGGLKMIFKAHNPAEAARALQHAMVHDGMGIFERKQQNGSHTPLSISMEKRVRAGSDMREFLLEAFRISYMDLSHPGQIMIHDTSNADYRWMGNEKIFSGEFYTFEAPSISDFHEALSRAGERWEHVNLMRPGGAPMLRLVQS